MRRLAMLAVCLTCARSPVLAQDGQPERRPLITPTISVTGDGRVSADPDLAVVRLGFSAQAAEAAAVQNQVNERMQKVIEAVKEIVPREQIQTSSLNLYPVYSEQRPIRGEDPQPQEPRIVGYRSDMSVVVRVKELARVGDVIDAGLAAGANRLDGISFELENETQARAQALQRAVRSAQEKARAIAAALDVELMGVAEAIEGGAQVISPMYDRAAGMEMLRAQAAGTPVEGGQIQVNASVTLRYRMSGAGVPPRADQPAAGDRRDRIGEPRPSQPSQPRQ
jgi:uncharacterized protein